MAGGYSLTPTLSVMLLETQYALGLFKVDLKLISGLLHNFMLES